MDLFSRSRVGTVAPIDPRRPSVVLLALAGRPVCDQLSGDGVAELAER